MNIPSTSFLQLLENAALAWGLIACGFAQLLKLVFEVLFYQRWRPAVLLETGGMPSSHSALVTGTASGIGLELGFDDPVFAIAGTFAFIVMYDASGVRKSAGLIAKRVNELPIENWPTFPDSPLKEALGHSRFEVLVGSIIGPLVVFPGITFVGSPLQLINHLGLFFG